MGYFYALKLAFLSSLIRKYMLWEGFYHDFSTKKVSASGGFAPWPPPGGAAPWTPKITSPPLTIYPGATPVHMYIINFIRVFHTGACVLSWPETTAQVSTLPKSEYAVTSHPL